MPKRSCPFAESFSTQYKIHVGQKELNLHGVFGNKYRQEVYEKTKNLLFNGTRAVMGRLWKADSEGKCSDVCNRGEASPANQMLLRGQTLIGPDGKLKKAVTVSGPQVCGRHALCVIALRVPPACSSAATVPAAAAPSAQ
ncbi:Apoptosis regulatory protein Siva [Bagarius yarrelli]|uniref:Apoptosis regulatory protein Siva n=1 Tax=Bagarius yarrelli TaxID=175774 RepID=A0A556V9W6_BAGYA|nr:Apoptosis regulatory protein Siva [Bagarius yarrelli]